MYVHENISWSNRYSKHTTQKKLTSALHGCKGGVGFTSCKKSEVRKNEELYGVRLDFDTSLALNT